MLCTFSDREFLEESRDNKFIVGRVIVMKISNLRLPLTNKHTRNQQIKLLITSIFKGIAQRLIAGFVGGDEIRIWQTYDRFGNNWWHAYDPVTGRYTCKDSEAEMRVWIEQRYLGN